MGTNIETAFMVHYGAIVVEVKRYKILFKRFFMNRNRLQTFEYKSIGTVHADGSCR
jgi:hypothetical protein